MPISYRVDQESGVIFEEWSGKIDISDLADFWTALIADMHVLRLHTTLVDMTTAEFAFSADELFNALIRVIGMPIVITRWRTAFLVATPAQQGVAIQLIGIMSNFVVANIFEDAGTALAWLTGQSPADS